jgi:hypothetical protein
MRLILSLFFLFTFKAYACPEINTINHVYAKKSNNSVVPYITIYAPSKYKDNVISEIQIVVKNDFYISSFLKKHNDSHHLTTIQLSDKLSKKTLIVITYKVKGDVSSFCGPMKVYELSDLLK